MEYNKNQVINIIKENGYIPLDFEWNGHNSIIRFKDALGYKYAMSWSNFNRDNLSLKPIINTNPYYFDNMKNYIIVNNIECEIVSEIPPKNIYDKIIFKGKCGHEFERDWSHYTRKTNSKDLCPNCFRKLKPHRKTITIEQYNNLFSKYGFTILENLKDGKKRKNDTKIEVKDKYGYKGFMCYSNLQQRKEKCNFMPFSKFNKWSIYNIRHYFEMNNIKTKVISEQYIDYNTKIKFQCACGNYFYRTFPNKKDTNYVCIECSNKMSNLERNVKEYLDMNNIKYEMQKTFEECRDKNALPFDFYIKDKNICIEVQGEQHYFPIIFGNYSYEKAFDNFIKQQERDKIKKKYCEDNGIKLILLDYKCIRDNTFKDILLKNF